MDREHAEPVVNIPAKVASFYFVTEVPICRRDDAHVYMARLIITHTLELSFLQYAEQLALQLDWDFPTSSRKMVPLSAS